MASENRLQLVPNWNGITIPDTTPIPNETEKILIQNIEIGNRRRARSRSSMPSSTAMYEAKPTVKAGSRICHAITQTNCSRDRNSGSESMVSPRFPSECVSRFHGRQPFAPGPRGTAFGSQPAAGPLPGTCISSLSIGVADRKLCSRRIA